MAKNAATLLKNKIEYEKYVRNQNYDHDIYIKNLKNDERDNIILSIVEKNLISEKQPNTLIDTFMIKDTLENNYVGMCMVKLLPTNINTVLLEFFISEKDISKRENYYKDVLSDFSNKLLDNTNIYKVITQIKDENISFDTIYDSGFEFDYDLNLNKPSEDLQNWYSKNNNLYQNIPLGLPLIKKYNLGFFGFNKRDPKQINFLMDCEKEKDMFAYINEIKHFSIDNLDDGQGYLVMDLNEENYVGLCITKPSIYDVNTYPRPLSVYYAVAKEYRNRGYGTVILKEIRDYIFANNLCDKINLEITSGNNQSLNIAKKAGFESDNGNFEIFQEEGYDYVPMSLCKKKINNRG